MDWSTLGVRRLGTKVTNFPIKTARVAAQWLTTEAAPIADDTNEAGSTMTLTVLPNASVEREPAVDRGRGVRRDGDGDGGFPAGVESSS